MRTAKATGESLLTSLFTFLLMPVHLVILIVDVSQGSNTLRTSLHPPNSHIVLFFDGSKLLAELVPLFCAARR